MKRADFHSHVGELNVCANIGLAIARAEELHVERERQRVREAIANTTQRSA
jgi:hypothetical protein